MKIYFWNILYRNKELNRAFELVSHADFDLFCLQEVPESFLAQLQTLPYHLVFRTDAEKLLTPKPVPMFHVILSKHPLTAQGDISFPEYWHLLPLRTRLFVHLMPSRFFSKIRNRGVLYADVSLPGGTSLRLFSFHAVLAQPAWRLKEFETAMLERDPSRPTIVCGDFNTIQAPHVSLLNWILGGSVGDALFYRRERTRIEKHFVEHDLVNPLFGGVTHPLSQSQLDHILVSRSFTIKQARILPDRMGSDHHPIYVEVS